MEVKGSSPSSGKQVLFGSFLFRICAEIAQSGERQILNLKRFVGNIKVPGNMMGI